MHHSSLKSGVALMLSAQEKGENAQFSLLLQEPPGDQVHLSEPGVHVTQRGSVGMALVSQIPFLAFS